MFLAEGRHLVLEALSGPTELTHLFHSPRLLQSEGGTELLERAATRGVPTDQLSDELLASLQDARSAQPVLAEVRRPTGSPDELFGPDGSPGIVVVAHSIQDPGNLGTLLRSAHAAGVLGFVCCGAGADPFHPRAVRATAGAVFQLPPLELDSARTLEHAASGGFVNVGTAANRGVPYDEAPGHRRRALWFGSEGAGLPAQVERSIDEWIHIPMRAGVESLSVAAAAAVLLFDAARRERINPRSRSGE